MPFDPAKPDWMRCVQCISNPIPIGVGYFGQYCIKPLLGFLIAKVCAIARKLLGCHAESECELMEHPGCDACRSSPSRQHWRQA